MPARSGDAVPFGMDSSTSFETHPLWGTAPIPENRMYDIGMVRLTKPLGARIGWFGVGTYRDAQLANMIVNNAGYPADKPLGTQWFNAGRILKVQPNTLTYGLDTEPGQSGSPIFQFTADSQRIVVAVHAYGDSGENIGIRITNDLYDQIAAWVS